MYFYWKTSSKQEEGEGKKEKWKLLGCCICHPRLQHNLCQRILGLVTWTVKSSFLLSFKPTNKKLVPQVTLMTWITQLKAVSEWCTSLTQAPQHTYHIRASEHQKSQATHRALSTPLGRASNWDWQKSGKAMVMNIKALYSTGTNWCRLGMRSRSTLSGALHQYNTTQPLA